MSRPVAIPATELHAAHLFFEGTPQPARVEIALSLLLGVTDHTQAERLTEAAHLIGRKADQLARVTTALET